LLEAIKTARCDGLQVSCEDGHWYIDVTAKQRKKQQEDPSSDRVRNLTAIIDGYFKQGGQHININVMTREKLLDAMEHPEAYPGLTIRVSGYAVRFDRLSREQQHEVILRTFHDTM
jgi:pyruvate-formate lyase